MLPNAMSNLCVKVTRYPLTAVGDVNTYALFAELIAFMYYHTGTSWVLLFQQELLQMTQQKFFSLI